MLTFKPRNINEYVISLTSGNPEVIEISNWLNIKTVYGNGGKLGIVGYGNPDGEVLTNETKNSKPILIIKTC